ncbi:solute carrier organic anion transporter family member 3A1-like isoform X2 [Polypterus senegalus]|uniref:solute carrier organic anion transporter family member 3A1-like isoform X2 n=1 Tax=Polypterus senegalus TaxID=55291 RepID=UPI0019629C71|nr:solute carrier organic anion transporter family member 3A1-like isoform X2 [Polypterus senegalus]
MANNLQENQTTKVQKKQSKSCFGDIRAFVATLCLILSANSIGNAYLISMLSTLEKRFSLRTTELGLIASGFEIGNLLVILLVSYFGGKGHRPRLIGCGGIIMALGSLLCALPEFVSHQYDYQKVKISTSRDTCSIGKPPTDQNSAMESCEETQSTNMMYMLMVVAQVLIGIGASSVQPLGVSYMDDHVKKKDSSLYLEKLNITTDDPRWIGAWWAGFLVCAVLLFFTSLIMFGFPRSMPLKNFPENKLSKLLLPVKEPKEQGKNIPDGNREQEKKEKQVCCHHFLAILSVTKQLLQNPVFACIVLAACMGLAAIGGMSAFLGKYLESQFGLNTAYANQLIGVAAIPCVCLGMFLGGYLVKKCNLTPVGIVKLGMAANMLCSAAFVFLLFLGCETGPVAGLTSGYMNRTDWDFPKNLTSWCNEECGCTLETLNPICGSDGITYMSPCFAGCIDTNFTSCACINTGSPIGAAAVPGQCPSSGCQGTFHVFFAVFCTGCFIGAMGHTPTVVILIRAVNPIFKSYALGIQFLLLRVLAFIPMPLVFGAAIDSTCLAWSESCGKRRTCSLYNNDSYRYLYFSISVGLKTAALILMTIVWHCIKSNPKKYLHGDEDSTEKLTPTELFASTLTLETAGTAKSAAARTTFIYHLGDNEMCENIESVL